MTNAAFTALLRHPSLPAWLRTALDEEVQCGVAKDSRLLLAAAVEGLLQSVVPGLHRHTVLVPLTAARLLATDAVVGKRLWQPTEKAALLAKIGAESDPTTLLEYWCRARAAYRRREARDKITYADGRPADLSTLKAA